MKNLFIKIIFTGIFSGTYAHVYASLDALLNTDTDASLRGAMKAEAVNTYRALQEAEQAAEKENGFVIPAYSLFTAGKKIKTRRVSSKKELEAQALSRLERDRDALDYTKSIMETLSKKADKVRKKLKTVAARKVLDSMEESFSVPTRDLEDQFKTHSKKMQKKYPVTEIEHSLRERSEEAYQSAFGVLTEHITAEILTGSSDERADLQTLVNHFRQTSPYLTDFFEDNILYCILREKYAHCYDSVPKEDIATRFKILKDVISAGKLAYSAADDGDDLAVDYGTLSIADNYSQAIRLYFVDKAAKAPKTFIFKDEATFQRFEYFWENASGLFSFCEDHTHAAIQAHFMQKNWERWVYKGKTTKYVKSKTSIGSQIILVSPCGSTSIRLKQNGGLSVGFLAPYSSKIHHSYSDYLYDRTTELLKYSDYAYMQLALPAALNGDTPFWRKIKDASLVNDVVFDAHGQAQVI